MATKILSLLEEAVIGASMSQYQIQYQASSSNVDKCLCQMCQPSVVWRFAE